MENLPDCKRLENPAARKQKFIFKRKVIGGRNYQMSIYSLNSSEPLEHYWESYLGIKMSTRDESWFRFRPLARISIWYLDSIFFAAILNFYTCPSVPAYNDALILWETCGKILVSNIDLPGGYCWAKENIMKTFSI